MWYESELLHSFKLNAHYSLSPKSQSVSQSVMSAWMRLLGSSLARETGSRALGREKQRQKCEGRPKKAMEWKCQPVEGAAHR